jgi:hypothetical protein
VGHHGPQVSTASLGYWKKARSLVFLKCQSEIQFNALFLGLFDGTSYPSSQSFYHLGPNFQSKKLMSQTQLKTSTLDTSRGITSNIFKRIQT